MCVCVNVNAHVNECLNLCFMYLSCAVLHSY